MQRLINHRRLRYIMLAVLVVVTLIPAAAHAAGTFTDDNGNPHEPMIEAISAEGITRGCSTTQYCPAKAVTRAEMASFITRAFELPAASGGTSFTDISASPHVDDILRLAASGITNGCGNGQFCPSATVTRAEMAAFLQRVQELDTSAPDAFSDDNGNQHEQAINAIAASGVTNGCGNGAFCPWGAVTRAEMASFLGRALQLEPITPESLPVTGDVYITPSQSLPQLIGQNPEGTVFVLAPGVHFVDNTSPKNNQQFIGEDGAILSGNNSSIRAFGGPASGVTLHNLIFENYNSAPQGSAIGATGANWTVTDSEFRNNAAAGLTFYSGWIVRNNFIHHNLQIGF